MSETTNAQCWICGSPADSREHKIKRSDMVRRYGDQPFKNVGGMLHFMDGKGREVQGLNAKSQMYEPILCSTCNNARSQPWDKAYERFERWVFEHERETLARRFILLEEVFGTDTFSSACPALYKYFVKAFGCRLVDAGMAVPSDLVRLLPQDYFVTKLRLTFSINRTAFAMDPKTRTEFLGLGDLIRLDSRSMGVMARYIWHMQIGWLRVWFFYDTMVPAGIGSIWTSDSACIYLGEFESATLDELIEGVRRDNAPALAHLEALRGQGGIRIE